MVLLGAPLTQGEAGVIPLARPGTRRAYPALVQCDYFDALACRSCTLMGQPHADQLAAKQAATAALLASWTDLAWEPPLAGPERGFRNKAKMVAGGTVEEPTLGILDPAGRGVDLRGCGLHEEVLREALPTLSQFVTRAGLTPYDVPGRRGELKHVLVTASPQGELMVRWVLRSTEPVPRVRKQLPWLRHRLPHLTVASANIQPVHQAVLEGETELLLTEQAALPMRLAGLDLWLRPQEFFQTNTAVAAALYDQARRWAAALDASRAWDLYCGVGGFALALAGAGVREVVGVDRSAEAVAAGGAADGRPSGVRFVAGDAEEHVRGAAPEHVPDLVVVNPPRRGIGPRLAGRLEDSRVTHVLYSSCRPGTLVDDLRAMPSLRPVRARVFDMFPQTPHHEVLVLLRRSGRT